MQRLRAGDVFLLERDGVLPRGCRGGLHDCGWRGLPCSWDGIDLLYNIPLADHVLGQILRFGKAAEMLEVNAVVVLNIVLDDPCDGFSKADNEMMESRTSRSLLRAY